MKTKLPDKTEPHYEAPVQTQPPWRYFQRDDGPAFCWTVERDEAGLFYSFVYYPVADGMWKLSRASAKPHKRRHLAKERALRLLRNWEAS